MKRLLLLLLPIGLLHVHAASAQEKEEAVWSDEFNGRTLDRSTWNVETGTGVNGDFGTCQVDAATDRSENVRLMSGIEGADKGVLRIATRKERYNVPGGGARNYTSARINTKNNASWGPGHKLRARVWPRDVRYRGQGFAFWAMPDEAPRGRREVTWPQGGEIDIMEYVGLFPYNNLGSVHYARQWNNNRWMEGNQIHQGSYYSYRTQEVPAESPQWIYVDLGQRYEVEHVVLRWETAYGSSYKIQISDDAKTWTDVYSTTEGDGGVDDLTGLTGSGRYVRVYTSERGTQYGYSLYEVEVYEAGNETNLALDQPAKASSVEDADELLPEHAVDGDPDTRWASGNLRVGTGPRPPAAHTSNAGSSGWHVYGINWYSDHIDFVVDEKVYHSHYFEDGGAFTVANGGNEEKVRTVDGRRVTYSEYSNQFEEWHPFEHKMYVILSAGVGGSCTYGGAIDPDAEFPASVFVDWVRVYNMDTESANEKSGADNIGELIASHNYPDPFKSSTSISYKLPANAQVTLDVWDMTGRKVATLVDHHQSAGRHHARFDAANLPAGVYFYRIQAAGSTKTEKMVLLK